METRDPYEILQVSMRAEIEVIDAAYKRLAQKYHPDKNQSLNATSRMQDINWAYGILSNPEKREQYDSLNSQQRYPSPPKPAAPKPEPKQSYPAAFNQTASPKAAEKSKLSSTTKLWIGIGVLILIYILFFNHQSQNPGVGSSSTGNSLIGSSPTKDPYEGCIPWTQANFFDGESKCVYGVIVYVSYYKDDLSASDVWTAHFSSDPSQTFSLISVDRDISKYQGKCVVVYGTLMKRDDLRAYEANPQPSMVDSDPYDDRGFSIIQPVYDICQ